MTRVLLSVVAAVALVGCYNATHRSESDGDADGDGDVEIDPCPESAACEVLGFDARYAFDLVGEVVSVERDHAVFLGEDGVPATYFTCGPTPLGLMAPGMGVVLTHSRPEGSDDCWLSVVEGEGGPILVATECDGGAAPPLTAIGWSAQIESVCQGTVDQVCSASGHPVHLAIPEEVFDVAVVTDAGDRATVGLGESVDVGGWQVRLLDARATEAVSERGCSVPAGGRSALSIARRSSDAICPEPAEVERGTLGLSYSADESEVVALVDSIEASRVVLLAASGAVIEFGWYGPDPGLVLSPGQEVVVRRYAWSTTMAGFLDVIEAGGRPVLATISSDGFSLELPDLSVLGITLELGDPCEFDQGVAECTGEVLTARRYPVRFYYEGTNVAAAEVGESVPAGPYTATLLEAAQYPGMWCPDIHVEAWGPFGLTLQRLRGED